MAKPWFGNAVVETSTQLVPGCDCIVCDFCNAFSLYFRRCLISQVWLQLRWKCSTRWYTPALQRFSSASSPSSLHTYYTTGNETSRLNRSVQCLNACYLLTQITVHDRRVLPRKPRSASWIFFFNHHPVFFYALSSVRISRKSWHTLLNTCFHIAMMTAVFAGGITLTSHPIACQTVRILCS